ncbi:MAG: zinc ABC transporter substrate-binding protein [Clostridiales bacterium]|nr:zinc ABC transporter substrate-binding protein [Clostridiales bacterium]
MRYIRSVLTLFITAVMAAGVLCSCSAAGDDERLDVVVVSFSEYDWTRNIAGDNPAGMDITLIMDNGVDPHSFQPSSDDIVDITTCDILIFTGGESEEWVRDALENKVNEDMIIVDLMDVIGDSIREEETKEGMSAEDGEDEEETEYDEHIWLSLRNAAASCEAIEDALSKADPDNESVYSANKDRYISELTALDSEYKKACEEASVTTIIVADRFPFIYLTADYGLDYYAAFPGCSAETQADFETVIFLAGKADELNVPALITTETGNGKIASTIKENCKNSDMPVLILDSIQSVDSKRIENGESYLGIMKNNLEVLKKALG